MTKLLTKARTHIGIAATVLAVLASMLALPFQAYSAQTVCSISNGCTGIGTTPSYGQLLVGTGAGTYALAATSTLGISGGSGAVSSVFGRTGIVTAQSGDYTTSQVTEGSNLYWTNTRFDNRLSATTTLPNIVTLAGLSLPTSQLTGTLAVSKGGTGTTTLLANGLTYFDSSNSRLTNSLALTFNPATAVLNVAGYVNTDQYSGYKQANNLILYASTTNFTTFGGVGAGAAIIASATSSDNTSALGSTAFGYHALQTATSTRESTAFGYLALSVENDADANLGAVAGNSAFGGRALQSNTVGYGNTAVGRASLLANTTGNVNTAIGTCLEGNTTGSNNVCVGYDSLVTNSTGGRNTAIGFDALVLNTTGNDNTALGFWSDYFNTTGNSNVSVGKYANTYNSSATSTTAVGNEAGYGGLAGGTRYNNQGGALLGYRAGYMFQTGSDFNTLIGYQSGYNITTGKNNIWIGAATSSNAIANLTTGSQNILVGNNISLPSASASGQLNIGNILFGTGITTTGTTVSGGNIGIGTTTPITTFSVVGTIYSGVGGFMFPDGTIQTTASAAGTNYWTSSGGNIYNNTGTNVGIGTVSPSYKLDVAGFANVDQYSGYKQAGSTILTASSTNATTFAGIGAGAATIAFATSSDPTSGFGATAFGYQALSIATSSVANTAFGYQALTGTGTGTFSAAGQNSAFGYKALTALRTSSGNTAVGASALQALTTGNNNTAVGANTLVVNSSGAGNTAVGSAALDLTTGGENTGIGNLTFTSNTTGTRNTGVGRLVGEFTATGNDNTLIGYSSGLGVASNNFSNNTTLGSRTGQLLTTGGKNIFIGSNTGSTTATGANNILLGYDIANPVTDGSNQLSIGNLIFGTGINGEGLNLSTGNIGIGTTTPAEKLDVNGSIFVEGSANGIVVHDTITASCYIIQVVSGVVTAGAHACN